MLRAPSIASVQGDGRLCKAVPRAAPDIAETSCDRAQTASTFDFSTLFVTPACQVGMVVLDLNTGHERTLSLALFLLNLNGKRILYGYSFAM